MIIDNNNNNNNNNKMKKKWEIVRLKRLMTDLFLHKNFVLRSCLT